MNESNTRASTFFNRECGIHVCVFAKTPIEGEVKTRLGPAIGLRESADLAAAFLIDTWAGVQGLPWAIPVLAYASPLGPAWTARLGDPRLWPQGTGDLGARLERILRRAIDQGGGPAIVLGTDSPGLPRQRLEDARAALAGHDAVLGRCDDGGFYLLALRHCPPGLLAELPWSAPDTAASTFARFRALGMTVAEIEPWFDVDVPADLTRLCRHLEDPVARGAASHTHVVLEALRRRFAWIGGHT